MYLARYLPVGVNYSVYIRRCKSFKVAWKENCKAWVGVRAGSVRVGANRVNQRCTAGRPLRATRRSVPPRHRHRLTTTQRSTLEYSTALRLRRCQMVNIRLNYKLNNIYLAARREDMNNIKCPGTGVSSKTSQKATGGAGRNGEYNVC